MIPVGEDLEPLDDYYLWCDHRAWQEAAEITANAHESGLLAIDWCGGAYSSEWGFSKLLHWLRHNPDKRDRFATALEHCDFVAAVLCGIHDHRRSAAQHLRHGPQVDVERIAGRFSAGRVPDRRRSAADRHAHETGRALPHFRLDRRHALPTSGRRSLGLAPGIPIPVGAFDAHWDAIGAGVQLGDVVNVVGTSTCIMA